MTVRALYGLTKYMASGLTSLPKLYALVQEAQTTEDTWTLPQYVKATLLADTLHTHTLNASIDSLCDVTQTHSTHQQLPHEGQLTIQTDKEWQQGTTQNIMYYEGLTNTPTQQQCTREIVQHIKVNSKQHNQYLLVLTKSHKNTVQQQLTELGAQKWGYIKAHTVHLDCRKQRLGREEHIRAPSNANTQNIYIYAIHPLDPTHTMLAQRLRITAYTKGFTFLRAPIAPAAGEKIHNKYNWYPDHVYTHNLHQRQSIKLPAHLIAKGILPNNLRKVLTDVLKLSHSRRYRWNGNGGVKSDESQEKAERQKYSVKRQEEDKFDFYYDNHGPGNYISCYSCTPRANNPCDTPSCNVYHSIYR